MTRDFFRDLIRVLLIITMISACCQSFYFVGELSGNEKKESSYQDNSEIYYYDENMQQY